jgi:hypothetical protein
MSVQAVSASQLMNGIPPEKLAPTTICPTTPSTCYTLPGLGSLTKADISAILAQDPFLKAPPGQSPDASRYIYVQSNPLESTAVAAGVTRTFTVTDAQTSTDTTSGSTGGSESVSTGISAKLIVGIGLKNSDQWTWTQTVTHGVTTGRTQQASVTLASTTASCCGINNGVTCEVGIWEDMVYRTFVFVPQPETCQSAVTGIPAPAAAPRAAAGPAMPAAGMPGPVGATGVLPLSGTVTRGGTAAAGEKVVISDRAGAVLYRIVTDHQGRFFTGNLPPGLVRARIGKQVMQTTIKAGQGAVLNLRL